MKKIYFLIAFCFLSVIGLAQTTSVIYATASSGSYKTGNATSSARTDGNIVCTSTTQRGYAVFDISSIPAGSTINSCIIGYYVTTYAGSGTASGWNTYAYAGDLSLVTTASTLFSDMTAGTSVSTASYGTTSGTAKTIASNATTVAFISAHLGGKVSFCWTGGNGRTYTIAGETAAAATTGSHAPYLQINYTPPCTGAPAPGATNATNSSVCNGLTTSLSLASATTGAGVSYQWYAAPDVSGSPGTYAAISGANSATYATTITSTTWYLCNVTCSFSSTTTASTQTQIVDLPLPSAIGGGLAVCNGQNSTLTDATTGGSWTSGNTTIATINSSTGVLSGVAVGTTPVTYTGSNGCINTATATVNLSPSAISISPSTAYSACFGTSVNPTASATNPPVTLLNQDFNTGLTGAVGGTWTVVNTGASSPYNWSIVSGYGYDYISGDGTPRMESYPDGTTSQLITSLVSPAFSTVGYSGATLSFNYYVFSSSYYDAAAEIDYSIDGGTTWTLLYNYYNTSAGSTYWTEGTPTQSITLPSGMLGQSNVKLRWYYNSTWGFYWDVDNILVTTGSVTVPSSGFTWAGVSGAGGLSCINCSSPNITPTTPGNNVYNVTTTYGTCSSINTVTVNAIAPAAIVGNAPLCQASTMTLTDTISGGTWSSTSPGIASVSSGGVVTPGTSTGITNISYTLCGLSAIAPVTVNPLPNTTSLSTSAGVACQGLSVNMSVASSSLVSGTYTVNYTISGANSGTGSATMTVSGGTGTFTLPGLANVGSTTFTINTVTSSLGCVNSPSGGNTVTFNVNAIPSAISGAGTVCAASNITLTDAGGGNWTSNNISVATIGFTSGVVTGVTGGSATITYNLLGCTTTATVSVNADAAIVGSSGTCAGTSTTLTNASGTGTWTSSNTSVATVNAGTGVVTGVSIGSANISFTLTSTGCTTTTPMTITAAPPVYIVTGGGSGCAGSPTVHVGLNHSSIGYSYQLFSGTTPIGISIPGTGSALDFGAISTSGTYTIVTNPGSACATSMYGSATVSVNPLPNAYAVNGGGGYCTSGSGVHVGLAGSDISVDYQLFKNAVALGLPIPGSGTTIDFGLETATGTYTVVATNSLTGCTQGMTGNTTVVVNSLPTAYSITGGGGYCPTSTGSVVGLSNSTAGISYQLYVAGTPVGVPVTTAGGAFSFGPQSTSGTYTVVAANTVSACTSNMTGSTTVSVNPTPTVFTVTGGGSYCSGTTGMHIGLNSSTIGVNYQIYNGSSTAGLAVAGTGAPLDLGIYTASGTYTVSATSPTTTCSSNMTGSVTVAIIAPPNQYAISGGGSYCIGGTGVDVNLPTSDVGVNYQLYNGLLPMGTAMAGTGSLIDFGNQTITGAYTIKGTNTTTGCVSTMTGTASISLNLPPRAFSVTGGGSYCIGGTGVHVGMSATTSGASYQLYNGTTAVGTALTGSGAALDLGLQTASGGYTIVGTSSAGCSTNMTGSVFVSINPLPVAYTVGGGGGYCAGTAGTHITLSGSGIGTNYQLYNGSSTVGIPVSGTGGTLDFGAIAAVGTYSVSASTPATTCASGMTGSTVVAINPLPTPYIVTVGSGGLYCAGGAGVPVGVSTLATGIGYQLYRNGTAIGGPVYSSGSAITFGNETLAGTYSVVATNPATTCSNNMSTTVTVSTNPLPVAYTVSGGGGYCIGGTGVHITLTGSATGTTYQLFNSGVSAGIFPGTGSAIDFGAITATGTYSVIANNTITTCSVNMLSSVLVTTNPLPTAYTVTGGGSYCIGSAGVPVSLSSSHTAINYQLYNGSTAIGSPIAGTGSGLNFGLQTATGPYSVIATDAVTGCKQSMTLTVSVTTTSLPTPYPVTGGGGYCAGSAGSVVNLGGSLGGVSYQLFVGGSPTGTAVSGTGSGITFGPQTTAGIYTVVATGGCAGPMTGRVTVSVNPLPIAYAVSGGGSYCAGGTGLRLSLGSSQTGVNYQLYNAGSPVGGLVAGTGAVLRFGPVPAGSYEIGAINTTTSCINNMADTVAITVNPLPFAYALTGGGNYCAGGTGATITLAGSAPGVNYQLYNGTAMVGTAVAGTSAAIAFGPYTTTGVYSIIATDIATGCNGNMANTETVSLNPLPTAFVVTGGGNYCVGDTGRHILLSGSERSVSYQLYNGTTATGIPITGTSTGSGFDLGLQTATGVYTIIATNMVTGCTNTMSGSAAINVNPLPLTYAMTGGGTYCSGSAAPHIGISGSQSGISYQLMDGTAFAGSSITGGGSSIDFGAETAAGTYRVVATGITTGCVSNMPDSAIISVSPTPAPYTVTGSSATYCVGGTGVIVYVSNSDVGVTYQLYRGTTPIGTGIPGAGAALDLGPQTIPGTYTVIATATTGGCTTNMTGSAPVSIAPLPNIYSVTGGGNYCTGGTGAHVGLSSSQTGTGYQLYTGGSPVGSTTTGTGGAIDLGTHTAAGTYTIVAVNTTTGCTNNMSGSATIGLIPSPAVFTTTGGGNYCSGGTGVNIGLSNSVSGVSYQLYYSVTPVGGPITGTGLALSMGSQTIAGTYTIAATNTTTGCSSTMAGSATVGINLLPTTYAVTGGGNYCPGSAGAHVGLSNTATGISYQLYNGSTTVGSPLTGTGVAVDFGPQTASGLYKVTALNTTTGCTANMSGTAIVGISTLPDVYTVTGGGNYCSGTGGVHIGLSNSTAGISYQALMGTSTAAPAVSGTGGALDLGTFTAPGSYTVVATNGTTTCTSNMTGSAAVSVTTSVIPTVSITTGGSDTICAGTPTTFTATTTNGGSLPAYQWSVNGIPVIATTGTYSYLPANGDIVSVTLASSASCATPMIATNHVTMTVLPQLMPIVTITADPGNTVCSGTPVTFTATAVNGGSAPAYQWRKNGGFESTTSTYSFVPSNGDVVYCQLNSSYHCKLENIVNSPSVNMDVASALAPTLVVTANPGTHIASGEVTTFTATITNGVTPVSYQWYVNSGTITGANLPFYTNNNFADLDSVYCIASTTGTCSGNTGSAGIRMYVSNVGVQQVNSTGSDIQLEPNPNKGAFTLKGSLGNTIDQEVTIEITNMLGQNIYTSTSNVYNGSLNKKIQLGNIANGMYLVNLHTSSGNTVLHMVVEQ